VFHVVLIWEFALGGAFYYYYYYFLLLGGDLCAR
jgi:hypothetical protein